MMRPWSAHALLGLLGAALATGAVRCADATPALDAPALDAAARRCWQVAPNSLSLTWQARWGETPIHGGFRRADVAIRFDPDHPEATRIHARIPIASLYASDPEAVTLLTDPAWFDPARYPQADFTAEGLSLVEKNGARRHYRTEGRLRLKGRDGPLALDIWLAPADDKGWEAEARAVIDRTVYDIGAGAIAAATAPDVALHIHLMAIPITCPEPGRP